jgi:uncharacterized protein YbaR (Trm112 family)
MALDSLLIEVLADPIDKGTLLYFDDEGLLLNERTSTTYAVNDGIPVLLPDEGRSIDETELARLLAKRSSAVVTGAGS